MHTVVTWSLADWSRAVQRVLREAIPGTSWSEFETAEVDGSTLVIVAPDHATVQQVVNRGTLPTRINPVAQLVIVAEFHPRMIVATR